jgi:response regulator NasT
MWIAECFAGGNGSEYMARRILVVTEDSERAALLRAAVTAAGDVAAGAVQAGDDLCLSAVRTQPDAVVVWFETANDLARKRLGLLARSQPLPVAVFADRASAEDIRRTVKVGVGALVVDGFRPDRVGPVLELAIARFAEIAELHRRWQLAETRLVERGSIERAKGILMRRRNLPEDAAFDALRQMARERRKRLREVADSVIAAEEMLARG